MPAHWAHLPTPRVPTELENARLLPWTSRKWIASLTVACGLGLAMRLWWQRWRQNRRSSLLEAFRPKREPPNAPKPLKVDDEAENQSESEPSTPVSLHMGAASGLASPKQ